MRARALRDLTAIVLTKAVASGAALAFGFRAISDDDYARVVIAQRFAESPSFDPSGTSWLPFPFWLLGAPMLALGPSLELARVLALLQGIGAALLVYVAAAWLALPRGARLLAALIGSVFPYAVWTGVATVPDGFVPALLLLGCAAQHEGASRARRSAGALALFAAGLSRYEAWPVILVSAAIGARHAFRHGTARDLAIAGAPLLGPALWMLHGALHHDDSLFFLTRVAAYRRALAVEVGSAFARGGAAILAPIRFEPELVALTSSAVVTAAASRRGLDLSRWRPLFWALGAQLVFLVVGELGAAGPTHHGERAVLLFWLTCAVLLARAGHALWAPASTARRAALIGGAFGATALVALLVRPWAVRLEPFACRLDEEAIGRAARSVCNGQSVAVDAPDYGFFAVMAAFARPSRIGALDDHDPRRPRQPDPFASPGALRARLELEGARCLVTSGDRAGLASQVGHARAAAGRFVLFELGPDGALTEVSREPARGLR